MELFIILALLLLVIYALWRSRRTIEEATVHVLSWDTKTLYSSSLGLSGRPDRIVRLSNGDIVPEEKKSTRRLYDNHELQMGVYLLLVEAEYGIRPTHGIIELGSGERITISNSETLRTKTLNARDAYVQMRAQSAYPVPVTTSAAKCRQCGFRSSCTQSAA